LLWYICVCDSFVAVGAGDCICDEVCSGTAALFVLAVLTGGDTGAVLGCCEDDFDSVFVKERFVLLLLLD